MEATLVCVLSADTTEPTFHRIGKDKIGEDERPTVFTGCGRRCLAGEWPARLRLGHAKMFAKPCLTCWPDYGGPVE